MKKFVMFLAVLLCLISDGVWAQSNGTIAFSGSVVVSDPSAASTKMVTESTTQPDGTVTTLYRVESTSTGATLATFNSRAAAQWFKAQLNPTVAYRTP